MKQRRFLLVAAVLGVLAVAAVVGSQQPRRSGKLLLLEWATKAAPEKPPVAVLLEFGTKDEAPTSWNGRTTVAGAKVVHREGYRFRQEDRLTEPDGWETSSRRGVRVPARQPAVARMEGFSTVGIVLHLAELAEDAALTVEVKDRPSVRVAVRDLLGGKRVPLWDGKGVARLVTTATPVAVDKTEDDFPAAAYGPDGTLWVAYIGYHLKEEGRRIEAAQLKEQPRDFKAFDTSEFGDQLFLKAYRDGKWGPTVAVTGPKEDLVRCAVAVNGDGEVTVAYSARRNGRYDIYVRTTTGTGAAPQLGAERKLSQDNHTSALNPVACTDEHGQVNFAWQAGTGDVAGSWVQRHTLRAGGSTQTGTGSRAAPGNGCLWQPALASGSGGRLACVYDGYEGGDYDVSLDLREITLTNDGHLPAPPVAASSRYEARPSVAYDPQGRLWIAYEDGPENWGKDYGALDAGDGSPLYSERSVKVVCVVDGRLMQPVAVLPVSKVEPPRIPFEAPKTQAYERAARYSQPKLGIDGKGRVWLTYRQKFGSRYSSHPGSYWLTFARRLDGDHWTEPVEVHHSDGLLDHRPVLLPHSAGGLRIVHNTDGRYTTPERLDNQIYMSYLDLPGEPQEPKLVAHEAGKKDPKIEQRVRDEATAVRRLRDHRVEAGGKQYRLLRGEYHRHTEISWDGGPDGSLEDMFRYAIDAAAMDWIGNGDHDNGAGREYSWWLTQKLSDAYHAPGRFTPMFTYERSVAYPHGHRNVMFARRGVRTLPRLAAPEGPRPEGGVHPDDTKMLYRYLRELDGICAVHTSATSMGTDWRDNDPQVEPVVEIYQGDRMSYEAEGAPRAGYEQGKGQNRVNVAGWYPKGFINLALQKGHRLGFQASSDHWSTHISYFVVLAEKNDRAAILDAVKRRHCYGATDDMVLDVRSGDHVQGDEFQTTQAPRLEVVVRGTKQLAKVDVLRDSKVVATLATDGADYRGTWTDPAPVKGVHYYYVRVVQADGELAWSSPMWISAARSP